MMSQERARVNGRWRTRLQMELSEKLGADVMGWIERQHRTRTYKQIRMTLFGLTGHKVAATTLARWMSYERNGR